MGTLDNLRRRRNELLDGIRHGLGGIYQQLTTGTTDVSITGTVDTGNATITIEGSTYALVLLVDSDGNVVEPVEVGDMRVLLSNIHEELIRVNEKLALISEA